MSGTEIGALEMVRSIRDRFYEETRDLSPAGLKEFIARKAAEVLDRTDAEEPLDRDRTA